MSEEAHEAQDLVQRISHLLAGHSPTIQSAALADLLSIWLAGHFADTPEKTAEIRANLLKNHVEFVERLLPVNEQVILQSNRKSAH